MIVTAATTLCSLAIGSSQASARGGVWADGASSDVDCRLLVRLLPVRMGAFAVKLLAAAFLASSRASSNMALDLAPFGRWTLRDKAAQRRSALR
jgi:hypothetical protein